MKLEQKKYFEVVDRREESLQHGGNPVLRGGDGGKNPSDGIELENALIREIMFEDS